MGLLNLAQDLKAKMEMDLLNVDPSQEEHLHKLKKLVQAPNSYFFDVRCSQCLQITCIFSHSQTSVPCPRFSSSPLHHQWWPRQAQHWLRLPSQGRLMNAPV